MLSLPHLLDSNYLLSATKISFARYGFLFLMASLALISEISVEILPNFNSSLGLDLELGTSLLAKKPVETPIKPAPVSITIVPTNRPLLVTG